jgi:Icc-related predicted phosphoesterase
MRIQYISDLHIEMMNIRRFKQICEKISPKCEILVLAGDIGNPMLITQNYKSFLDIMSKKFKKVFLITGNHEYYGNDIYKTDEYIANICSSKGNISFLNNATELYNGYRFIGSTQWTRINEQRFLINDFTYINNMSVERYNDMHQKSRDFLKKSVNDATLNNEKSIVITHHLPLHELTNEKYKTHHMMKYQQCFSSNMKDVFGNENTIKSWIYGHTHTKSVQNKFGIPFLCNPFGYDGENEDTEINITTDI